MNTKRDPLLPSLARRSSSPSLHDPSRSCAHFLLTPLGERLERRVCFNSRRREETFVALRSGEWFLEKVGLVISD